MSTAYAVTVENASHEVLGSTKLDRAISLVYIQNKAVIVESDDNRVIRTVGGVQLPYPTVIRLLNYKKVPFYSAEETWSRNGVLRRDNFTCAYCGKHSTINGSMTVDHIEPKSKGGQDTWLNTITSCQKDNSAKADKSLEEFGKELRFKPTIPMRIFFVSPGSKRYAKHYKK